MTAQEALDLLWSVLKQQPGIEDWANLRTAYEKLTKETLMYHRADSDPIADGPTVTTTDGCPKCRQAGFRVCVCGVEAQKQPPLYTEIARLKAENERLKKQLADAQITLMRRHRSEALRQQVSGEDIDSATIRTLEEKLESTKKQLATSKAREEADSKQIAGLLRDLEGVPRLAEMEKKLAEANESRQRIIAALGRAEQRELAALAELDEARAKADDLEQALGIEAAIRQAAQAVVDAYGPIEKSMFPDNLGFAWNPAANMVDAALVIGLRDVLASKEGDNG